MEWKLEQIRKSEYESLMNSAQQVEATIGSNYYRIAKLVDMRKDLDATVKKWWDEILIEMRLDKNRDYMITPEGTIKDVTPIKETPPQPETKVGKDIDSLV